MNERPAATTPLDMYLEIDANRQRVLSKLTYGVPGVDRVEKIIKAYPRLERYCHTLHVAYNGYKDPGALSADYYLKMAEKAYRNARIYCRREFGDVIVVNV